MTATPRVTTILLLAALQASGCVGVVAEDASYRGRQGVIFVAPVLDGPWMQLGDWFNSGVSIHPNGTLDPDIRFVSEVHFTHADDAGVFGKGRTRAPGTLDGPSPLRGQDAVLAGRGQFLTDWPEDLGGGTIYQIKGWGWDAFYAVTKDEPGPEAAFDVHLLLHRDAASAGGFKMYALQANKRLAAASVDERFRLEPAFAGVPVVAEAKITDAGPLTDLEVRIVGRGQTVASGRLGGTAATAQVTLEFVPKAGVGYELQVAGRATSQTLVVSAYARLDSPVVHMFWENTTFEAVEPSLGSR
ncbi:MAG: hypothetical protein HYT80_11020 [Euryarchaeota archaeon]|nr:hypothetical protein [Euryarchaeota archaeon]